MSKSQQVIDIEEQIKEEMSLTPAQIKFKDDVDEMYQWLKNDLSRGLVHPILFNPLIHSELSSRKNLDTKNINELYSLRDVAKALTTLEYDNEKYINEGYL